ncbi:MAG TPA: PfaD family polyunsaturated fatty acid/polyketide biosynthesis protein [Myxococcales bacterium]|jgi:PfaD family protein|nr:PfaD family polyunsaturated fatty acid/polyketide biosynthesis protein [Myxococcales bacterium]
MARAAASVGGQLLEGSSLLEALERIREPLQILREPQTGRIGVGFEAGGLECMGMLPAAYPEWLGDRAFTETHRLRFPYVAGEMANGIATVEMVQAMARAGMLGFFGAAGLPLPRVEAAVAELSRTLGDQFSWGVNLIHSPADLRAEEETAALLVRSGVRCISASAFMSLTPALVRCSASGLSKDAYGAIVRRHQLFAKISRPEVAEELMSPAPVAILQQLVSRGELTAAEAELARQVPVAEDVTVEADSGGHTDNRPLGALFPTIAAIRDRLQRKYGYARGIRLGAAGGLGTPASVASAFSLGAAYVLTGSINQAAVESGLSAEGKRLLAQAGIADVIMAPAADMFELGVKVQVLRRGTMFGVRALRLYEVYLEHESLEAMPAEVRERLERETLGVSCEAAWQEVQRYFQQRDPAELERAFADPHHKMALVFRWYLGLASRWAINGDLQRRPDYQIWCGPAMGAFNTWTKGSFLETPENRSVVQIALNLLEGAAVIARAQQIRSFGVPLPAAAFSFAPRQFS